MADIGEMLTKLDTKIDENIKKRDEEAKEIKRKFDEQAHNATLLAKQLTEIEGRVASITPKLGVSLPGSEDAKFSFAKAWRAMVTNDWEGASVEKEIFKETEKRAVQAAGTDSLGGFLVPIQVSNEIIDELRNELIVSQLGVRTLTGLPEGIYEFNKKKSHAEAQPKSEQGRSQRTGMSFEQMRLAPHIVSAYIPVTERLLRAANPSIEAICREDLRLALAERMETGFFFGKGGSSDVVGIANMPNVIGANNLVGTNNSGLTPTNRHVFNADAANGHRLTIEDFISTLEMILSDNNALPRQRNGIKLATNNGVFRLARTEKYWTYDASGASEANKLNLPFRMNLPMTMDELQGRVGYPLIDSNIIPITGVNQGTYTGTYDDPSSGTKKLAYGFFGVWAEIYLAIYGGMAMRATRDASDIVSGKFYSAFTQNQVWIKADAQYDIGIRHDESMVVLNNLLTR